jgi:hypothetical protein
LKVLKGSMGLQVEEEQVVGGAIPIDALIIPPKESSGGLAPIAVGVDGPHHFFANNTRDPTGTTVFSRRLLDLAVLRGELGAWVSVRYWGWSSQQGDAERQEFLCKVFKAKGLDLDSYR